MSNAQVSMELLALKGLVAEMEPADQEAVKAAKAELTTVLEKHGDLGFIALTLVGAELAIK